MIPESIGKITVPSAIAELRIPKASPLVYYPTSRLMDGHSPGSNRL